MPNSGVGSASLWRNPSLIERDAQFFCGASVWWRADRSPNAPLRKVCVHRCRYFRAGLWITCAEKLWIRSAIKMCILDEADRMVDMGFREDMEIILGAVEASRQTLFFSATMNPGVEKLIKTFSHKARQISIERKALTVDSIEQTYYEVRNRSKVEVLCRLLDLETNPRGIVFCNTKQMVEDACEVLAARGYVADRIHGDITQVNRERVIKRFKDGSVELLVATDVPPVAWILMMWISSSILIYLMIRRIMCTALDEQAAQAALVSRLPLSMGAIFTA